SWSIGRDWGTGATFTWTPGTSNANYRIGVWARSAGGTADFPDAAASMAFAIVQPVVTSLALASDKAAPQAPGTTITFTATAAGGAPPYSYKFFVFDGTTWSATRDWSATTTFAWTPATTNPLYRVGVWARSAGNSADAPELPQSMPFAIVRPPVTVTIAADRPAPQPPGTR